jgi:hypothetical protein
VDYYSNDEDIPFATLEEMGTLLTAHLVQLRLTEPKKISLRDLQSNLKLIEIKPTRYLNEFKDMIRDYRAPSLMGT